MKGFSSILNLTHHSSPYAMLVKREPSLMGNQPPPSFGGCPSENKNGTKKDGHLKHAFL